MLFLSFEAVYLVLHNVFMLFLSFEAVYLVLHNVFMLFLSFEAVYLVLHNVFMLFLSFEAVYLVLHSVFMLFLSFEAVYLILHNVFMLFLSFEAVYGADCAYCYLYFENGEGNVTDSSQSLFLVIEYIVMSLEYGLPPIITFFTFLTCIIKLQTRSDSTNSTRNQKTAAVTVTIFTALFLVCNCPLFILIILTASYVLTHFSYYSVEAGVFSNRFMSWYSWPISRLGLTVVNASLNPLVYYWRMPGFRKWIKDECKV